MLTSYIEAAMRKSHYAILAGEEGYFGRIDGLQGVWANAEAIEGCREELKGVLEEWLLLGLRLGHELPAIHGIELNVKAAV